MKTGTVDYCLILPESQLMSRQQVSGVWVLPFSHFRGHMLSVDSEVCLVRTYSFNVSFFTYSLLPKQGRWTNSMNELNWLQVKNFCQSESEEKQVQIAVTMHTVSRLTWLVVSGNRVSLSEQLCQQMSSKVLLLFLLLIYLDQPVACFKAGCALLLNS